MLKKEWEFRYSTDDLAKAAQDKVEHHTKRLAWWEQKKEEVMKEVRDKGITVQDSVASSVSNYKGGVNPVIMVEAGLQRDLNECQTKIMEHHRLLNEYDGWDQVLTANKGQKLSLHHEDWLYFFGK